MNRSIRRLYLVLTCGFGLLVALLGYWQVVAADSLRERSDNPQAAQAERLVDRGRIITADGQVLAESRPRRVAGQRVYRRVYPRGRLAPHVVGYVSGGAKTGIEDIYDRFLGGSFGTEPLLQRFNLKEKRGADVRLSLDSRVQAAIVEGLGTQRGAAVALDPTTGAVLGMGSAPGFDLARVISDFDTISADAGRPFFNRAIQGLYPPGSTFKVVTATGALESGVFGPDSAFPGGSSYATPGGPIRNFDNTTYGRHTLQTALTNSINTTFAQIGDELGPERLGDTMTSFGFGESPAIDLPGAAASGRRDGRDLLPNGETGEDAARVAIGQERLTVTPLQMAMVAASVANGGVLMAPRVMARITDRGGAVVRRADPDELGRVLSTANAAALTSMMEDVVREGTGTAAALSEAGVTVAGKTGTAETGDANVNQAWFIGFAPSVNPVVAVAVVIEDTSGTGGVTAAPVAAGVMRAAIDAR